ncbi:Heparanase-like protein 3 [Glycine soja]
MDQLDMSTVYDTRTYCKQSLIRGNYGLLNTSTFMPNPNYYRCIICEIYFDTLLQKGITILVLNLDNNTTIEVNVALKFNKLPYRRVDEPARIEYHLTTPNKNLHSQTMLLNGIFLSVNSAGEIPPLDPLYVNSRKPIIVGLLTIVFAHIPNVLLSTIQFIYPILVP